MIVNYEFKYRSRGKWFFVPNDKCERRARRMLAYFKRRDLWLGGRYAVLLRDRMETQAEVLTQYAAEANKVLAE